MEDKIIKIAGLTYTEKEIESEYLKGNIFIFKYKSIYQIYYSNAQKTFHAEKIRFQEPLIGYTKKGRHIFVNAEDGNKLIEHDFLKQ